MFLNWLRVVHDSKEQRQNDSEIHALLFPLFGFSGNGLVFTLRAKKNASLQNLIPRNRSPFIKTINQRFGMRNTKHFAVKNFEDATLDIL